LKILIGNTWRPSTNWRRTGQLPPVKFNGKDIEHIFDAKMRTTKNRLAFVVYMLIGEAEHWWMSMKSIMEEREEPVTLEAFKGKFLFEYFPDSVRHAKEVEFL